MSVEKPLDEQWSKRWLMVGVGVKVGRGGRVTMKNLKDPKLTKLRKKKKKSW